MSDSHGFQDPTKAFYDQGWNDRIDNKPWDIMGSTYHYRDGWKDCAELSDEERKELGKI
jgi:hypothetical protein